MVKVRADVTNASSEALAAARSVEADWNAGRYDDALAGFESLARLTDAAGISVGCTWRAPVPTPRPAMWDTDVRIGARDSLLDLAFDTHLSSGNLFVAVRHGTSMSRGMSVCMSTDGGAAWSETYSWSSADTLTSLDAAVAASHFYIAYCYPGYPREVRMRRLLCTNGTSDTFSNGVQFVTPCTLAVGDTTRVTSLASNQHGVNTRLYLLTIASDGSIAYCWDDTGAVSWTTAATGITSGALSGLDATENEGYDSTFLFFSYLVLLCYVEST